MPKKSESKSTKKSQHVKTRRSAGRARRRASHSVKKETANPALEAFKKVVAVIKKHGHRLLNIPGVRVDEEDIRPGYKFRNRTITNTPAVVVSIHPRDKNKKSLFPTSIGGVPVRVKLMTPSEQLRRMKGESDAAASNAVDDALNMEAQRSGDLALPAWNLMDADEDEAEAEAGDVATQVKYNPRPDDLIKVREPMRVICHVSPEEGWKNLSAFFARGKDKNLTIAMYDFTAPHVLSGLNSLMDGSQKRFRLILDPGVSLDGEVKVNDVPEEKVRDTLSDTAGDRFDFLWGAVKRKGKVAQGIFPTAYHIKVAVSGGKSFWLSSGNWQSSNQPDLGGLDLNDKEVLARVQKRYNREWHVIVDHPGLASIYEKFIKRDMKQARGLQVESDAPERLARETLAPSLELLVSRDVLEDAAHDIASPQIFEPGNFNFTKSRPLHVQPVLTPDNYQETVLPIIKSAKKTLYFQNQYIKVGKEPGDKFSSLLDALLEKIKAGVEVKIILRSLPNAADELEALQFYAAVNHGIEDLSFIRYQAGSHTKGIVVDSKKVIVGSHNWSKQGVTENRDASLIFFSSRIAKYYEKIFEYDWDNLAKPQVLSDDEMPVVSSTITSGAAEMVESSSMTRVPWDFNEDLS